MVEALVILATGGREVSSQGKPYYLIPVMRAAGGNMSSSKNSGSNPPATRAWLAFGVVVSLVLGVVLGYFLSPEDDTSEIEQRVGDLEQELASMQNKTDMIEGAITGGEPLEQLACGMYLHLPDIPGGSEDIDHKDWILIMSYSYEGAKESDIAAAEYGDFTITKFVDKSSPKLAEAMNTGELFLEVILEIISANGTSMTYKLGDAKITGVRVYSAMDGVAKIHMEDVSFTYETIKWEYTSPGTSDTASESVSSGWDIVKSSPV
jgi:type VI secretion system Hcp family effector